MSQTVPLIFLAFPIVFTIHNIEEALWLPRFSQSAGKFHKPVGTFEFVFALAVLTILAWVITLLFYLMGKESIPCYLFFAFNFGMLVNVFFPHLAATIVLRRYCPGLLTGILLLTPTTVYLLVYGYENEYFSFPKFWIITIPFAGIIVGSLPLLFRSGRSLKKMIVKERIEPAAP